MGKMDIAEDASRVQIGDHLGALLSTAPPREKPTAPSVQTDPAMIRVFYETVFKHCGPGGLLCLRSVEHATERPATRWVPVGDGAAQAAAEMAEATADKAEPAVFCPPLCVFGDQRKDDGKRFAGESNIAEAPVLSIEIDEDPDVGVWRVIEVIGAPTILVRSGGVCKKTGQDKLHAHWRLNEPARGPEALARLKTARALATALAKGDTTSVSPAHPIRWPGSVHRKDVSNPRLAIAEFLDEITPDIDLDETLAKLQAAAETAGLSAAARLRSGTPKSSTGEPLDRQHLLALAEAIPNPNKPDWERWSRIGMAFHAASAGNEDGRDAFVAWSEKAASVFDPDAVDERWSHWDGSPAEFMTIETLVGEAERQSPGFRERFGLQRWFDADAAAEAAEHEARGENGAPQICGLPETADGWDEPDDIFGYFDGGVVPEPPSSAFPDAIARWARDISERMGAPFGFVASAGFVTAAGMMGSKHRIQVGQRNEDFTQPAILWLALIEEPGGKKSPVIAAATAPLQKIRNRFAKEDAAAQAEWEDKYAPRRGRRPAAEDASASGSPKPPKPIFRTPVIEGFTVESLRIALKGNPAVLSVQDELSELIASMDAYKTNKGADRGALLRLHDGGPYTVHRVSGTTFVENWGVSTLGGIQPKKIAEIAGDLSTDGLLQRHMVVLGNGEDNDGIDRARDDAAAVAYDRLITALAEDSAPHNVVRLGPEADQVWQGAKRRWKALRHVPGHSDAWRGHHNKWKGLWHRVLLVWHNIAVWERTDGRPDEEMISADTARRCTMLVDYLLKNSLRFYETVIGGDRAQDMSRWIAGYILTSDAERYSRRDLEKANGAFSNRERGGPQLLCDAMRRLELAGWVLPDPKRMDKDRFGPGAWFVNPKVRQRFPDRMAIEKEHREAEKRNVAAGVQARRELLQGV